MEPGSEQIIQFNTILTSLGLQDMKRDIIAGATDGRTDRTKKMSKIELAFLINSLNISQSQQDYKKGNKIRRSIMSMSYQLEIINSLMSNEEKITEIEKYIKSHPKTKALKSFVSLTVQELQKLHYQFEVFLKCKLQGK